MPRYAYELVEGTCKLCGGCFELQRPLSRPPLTECPVCRKPVRKVFGTVHTPKLLKKPSISEAKAAGFTVLERRGKGEFEVM